MSDYLAKLKNQKHATGVLQKLQKGGKDANDGTAKTAKRSFCSKNSTRVGRFPEKNKLEQNQTPDPDLSKILPGNRSEYADLWSRAHELADYIDGGTAPYEDRIKKLPELENLIDKMKAIEADIKPVSKTGPNNRKFWDSMIRCRVGTRSSQQVEIQPDALGDDPGQCPACGERQWWRLDKPDSKWICGRCHPPAGLDVFWMDEQRRTNIK